jgi:zinc/manganese transport system permease protein
VTGLSWNLLGDARQLLSYHFMLNALRAGTIVAVVAGLMGYFMVLRRQSFAGHTLAVVGFPGAAGATWLGLNPAVGYFGFCIAAALIIALVPTARSAGGARGFGDESAVIGTVQGFALALGFLFVSLYGGFLSSLNNLLFGTITGVSDGQVLLLLAAGVVCLVALALLSRRLLFVSIDPEVARASGIPVGLTVTAFLLLLGIAAAGTSQVTGSLLVFALLVAPAAAAAKLTARPGLGAALSVLIALAVTWVGEGVAFFSSYPIGFWVTSLAFAIYLVAAGYRAGVDAFGRRHRSRPTVLQPPAGVST